MRLATPIEADVVIPPQPSLMRSSLMPIEAVIADLAITGVVISNVAVSGTVVAESLFVMVPDLVPITPGVIPPQPSLMCPSPLESSRPSHH